MPEDELVDENDLPDGVSPFFGQINADRYRRQQFIRRIEKMTKRRLLVYFSNHEAILAEDVAPFEELCLDCDQGADVDLIIQSNGGDADTAEKLVHLIRSRCSTFRVIVVERAKSAGTMMALGADEIVMGKPSELGPIDPQITVPMGNGRMVRRPAQSFLDGIERIKNEVAKDPNAGLNPAYYPMLSEIDAALIDYCYKAIERSKKFATKWLQKHMLKGNVDLSDSIAEKLADARTYVSHGIAIDAQEAAEMGLKVLCLDRDNSLWKLLWQLHLAYEHASSSYGKFFESRRVALQYPLPSRM